MSEAIEENVEQKVDPVQIEKELLAEAKKKSEDPAEQAAMVFTMYKANFESAMKNLRKKGAHERLLKALVMSPLEKIELITEAEKEAFFFGDSMIQAKFVMMMDTYRNSAQELIDAQDLANSATIETEYVNEQKGE